MKSKIASLKKELNRLTRALYNAQQQNNRIKAQAIEARLRTVIGMIRFQVEKSEGK